MQNIGHAHDGLELFFLEEGQAIVYVGDQEEYVSAGEAVILRASLPHAGQALTPLAVRTVLRFDPDLIPISEPGHFIQHLLHQREVVRFALPVATRIRISWAYEQIEGSLTGKIEWAPIDALLGLILADLHYCVQRVGHPNLSMITPVIEYMRAHPHESLPVSELAASIHVSESYLQRLFRQHFGTSVQETWVQYKMEHARRLLCLGKSVQEAADATGYQSLWGFERAFRRVFHVSPSAYKPGQRRRVNDQ